MKKEILTVLGVAVFLCGVALTVQAGWWDNSTALSGPTAVASKTFDLRNATAQSHFSFTTYSGAGIVYARINSGPTLYKLASYSSTGKGVTKYNMTTPYRYVYVKYTTLLGSGLTAKVTHSVSQNVFSW